MTVHFYEVFLGHCNSAALVGVALKQLDISEKGATFGFQNQYTRVGLSPS